LYIISKDEEQWWTARNEHGKTGQIPVPYVQRFEDLNGTETRRGTGHVSVGNEPKRPHINVCYKIIDIFQWKFCIK
jgi:hypothetical protein